MSKVYKVINSKSISVRSISFPVGMVLITTDNVNPSTYTVGTWEAFASGRTLVGVNTSQTQFNVVLKTGGSITHTLTVAQIPSHTHSFSATTSSAGAHDHWIGPVRAYYTGGPYAWIVNGAANYAWEDQRTSYEGNHTHNVSGTTGSRGSTNSHNNLQPYITVYFWRRTA